MRRLLTPSVVAAVLGAVAALSNAGAGAEGGAVSAPPQRDVLPDLRAEPSETVELATSRGHRKLRFSTDVANLGPGPLELVPRKEDCDRDGKRGDDRTAYQAIRLGRGGRRRVRAGCMLYHADHRHWHFGRFVSAELRRATDGQLAAASAKVSFCLQDSLRSPRVPDERAAKKRYSDCELDATMGISAGWIDHYDPELSGQSIKLGRVPPGRYLLVLRADPENRLLEGNERNNSGAVTLELRRGTVRRVPHAKADR